jgi:hypothetical protein
VGEKPFEGFAPTGPANQNLPYLLHPLPRWRLQEIARKAAAARWGKKK